MALYSALVPVVEAVQWHKNGDHPDDHVINNINSGRIVGRHPTYAANNFTGAMVCPTCDKPVKEHGIINKPTAPNNILVCPGDYIEYVRDLKGRALSYNLRKRKEFESNYTLQKEGVI